MLNFTLGIHLVSNPHPHPKPIGAEEETTHFLYYELLHALLIKTLCRTTAITKSEGRTSNPSQDQIAHIVNKALFSFPPEDQNNKEALLQRYRIPCLAARRP